MSLNNTPPSESESSNLTSQEDEPHDSPSENSFATSTLRGLSESLLKLKSFALHGVILDGLLLWIDTQRRTVPENIWKQCTLTHFTKDEITNAKNLLWEVSDESTLGTRLRAER